MEIKIENRTSYATAKIYLDRKEKINAETNSMVSMTTGIKVETSVKGMNKMLLEKDSFFINTFESLNNYEEIILAPILVGDIEHIKIDGEFYLQSESYLASEDGIIIDTQWNGAKTFFPKENIFLIKVVGKGELIFSSCGATYKKSLKEGERYVVDTGHIVGFSETIRYTVKTIGGIKQTLFSDEGFIVEVEGPGDVFIQTRNQSDFIGWVNRKISKKIISKIEE